MVGGEFARGESAGGELAGGVRRGEFAGGGGGVSLDPKVVNHKNNIFINIRDYIKRPSSRLYYASKRGITLTKEKNGKFKETCYKY